MNNKNVTKLKKIIIDMFIGNISIEEFDENIPLVEYGVGLDSVANMELLLEIEKQLGVEIDESEINSDILFSFRSLLNYLEKLKVKT